MAIPISIKPVEVHVNADRRLVFQYLTAFGMPGPDGERTSTMLVEEFVLYAAKEYGAQIKSNGSPGKLMLHGHCHQRALVGTNAAMQVLRSLSPDAEEIQSGCCGMAGSFGFEKEHYDLSMDIGELVLFPAIRDQEGDFTVVSEGVSCRQQIEHGTGRKARHLVEILADAISETGSGSL